MAKVASIDSEMIEAKKQERQDVRAEQIAREQLRRHLEYENYLRNSPRWRELRNLIMARDEHLCRGCLLEPATEIHHVTYEHIFQELAWELVAVCRACHERAHGLYQAERATVTTAEGF